MLENSAIKWSRERGGEEEVAWIRKWVRRRDEIFFCWPLCAVNSLSLFLASPPFCSIPVSGLRSEGIQETCSFFTYYFTEQREHDETVG